MFHLTFFPTVKSTVTSFAWSEFVLWWIVWSVTGCTFKGFWNERGCCSSFNFVKYLESFDGILFSLLCRFHPPRTRCFDRLLDTLTFVIENTQTVLRLSHSLPCCCLVIFCCSLVTLIHTLTLLNMLVLLLRIRLTSITQVSQALSLYVRTTKWWTTQPLMG